MMFRGQKGADALSIFKWKWRGESSLTTGLLNDVPPEIELSDCRRIPSPGSESPSGLLNGESRNVEPITDLDLFFERLYNYYCEKGLWCIIIKWIVELLSLGFTICFSAFFLLFVDWNGLRNAKCGMDAVESGIKPCDLSKEALYQHPLTPFTLSKAIIVGYLGLFSVYWIFCFLRFFAQLKETLGIRHFYYNSLHVTDTEIQTIPWASILDKVVQSQRSQQLCVVKDFSAHDVVMRLMRKENYLIGMLNKGVLAFPVSGWVPGVGPAVKFSSNGVQHHLILTKTLEWTLNWCILQSMFDRNFCVRRDFISNPKALKKRLMVVGIVMLLLSPFLVIFILVFCFLRHAEQFYNHPTTASSRRWSNLSKWIFREFNEVDLLFKHRINSSVVHASDYLKQFPSPILSIIAKFISFVFGGFAAVLIFIAFLEESLLEGHIFGRNLFWYAAVFGTITAISRAAVTDELLVLDPEGAMSLVVQHTHYLPKRWRGKENSELVRIEFETLFQYTGMMLLEEIASIFLTPYLLLFVVPKRVDDILQFIADFTVHVEGVGHVCSFSVFDFQNHGNSNYGSPCNSSRSQRSSQGKMEKSFLSFQSSYPSWEPDAQGKQFLSTLRTFREEKLQGHGARPPYLAAARMWSGYPNFRGQIDRNGLFSREMLQNSPGIGYQPGSLWVIDVEQKSHPYLLDWYYTSRPHHENGNSNHIPRVPYEVAEEPPKDFWMLSNVNQREVRYNGDFWHHQFHDRTQSHLEASTSEPFFRESVLLQHHDSGHASHPTKSRWWARSGQHGSDTQTSFLEPPDFNQHTQFNYHDNFSDKIPEEEEHGQGQGRDLDWRKSHRSLGHEQQQQLDRTKSDKSPDHQTGHKSLDHERQLDWRSLDLEQQRLDCRDSRNYLDWRDFRKSTDHEEKEEEEEHYLDWREPHRSLDLEQCMDWRGSHKSPPDQDHEQRHLDWREPEPHRSLDHEQQHLDLDLDWRDSHNSLCQEQEVKWRNHRYHKTTTTLDEEGDQQRNLDEEFLDWRNPNKPLARTTFMDFDVGDYKLHFDDIYRRSPSDPKPENPEPWSS